MALRSTQLTSRKATLWSYLSLDVHAVQDWSKEEEKNTALYLHRSEDGVEDKLPLHPDISATRVLLHPERHSIDTQPSHMYSEAVRDEEARHVVRVDDSRSEIPYASQNIRNQEWPQQ